MTPALSCPMGLVLAALQGGTPADPGFVTPPAVLQQPQAQRAVKGKALYGGRMDHHVDSANFTVAWSAGDAQEQTGREVSRVLEESWEALISEQGWEQPVSSDQYMLWVLLDPDLGWTGYTTLYYTAEFPDGYPVIYINPYYRYDEAFFHNLIAHEFHHAVQFAMRSRAAPDEGWYWEASAQWAGELSLPDANGYASSAAYYSERPELSYAEEDGEHEYGMFLINAYLEESVVGEGAMLEAWREGMAESELAWDAIFERVSGQSPLELWSGFTAAMGNGLLRESSLYEEVRVRGPLASELQGSLPYLGSHYYRATEDSVVEIRSGSASLGSPEGTGDSVVVYEGQQVAVTVGDPSQPDYTLVSRPLEQQKEGDSGPQDSDSQPADSGGRDSGLDSALSEEGGDSGVAADGDSGEPPSSDSERQEASCGCAQSQGAPWAWLVLMTPMLWRRR